MKPLDELRGLCRAEEERLAPEEGFNTRDKIVGSTPQCLASADTHLEQVDLITLVCVLLLCCPGEQRLLGQHIPFIELLEKLRGAAAESREDKLRR